MLSYIEEYNLCLSGHVQSLGVKTVQVLILDLWQGLYQHRKKKHERVKSIIDYRLLCTLHSADVSVELIKDADT